MNSASGFSHQRASRAHLRPILFIEKLGGRLCPDGRELPAHERQRGWEATWRKGSGPISLPEFLDRLTVGGDEQRIRLSELETDGLAGGVDERRGRLLGTLGVVMRILGKDGGAAERGLARALPFGLDLGVRCRIIVVAKILFI